MNEQAWNQLINDINAIDTEIKQIYKVLEASLAAYQTLSDHVLKLEKQVETIQSSPSSPSVTSELIIRTNGVEL